MNKCPICKHPNSEFLGIMAKTENGKLNRYEHYRCLSGGRKHGFFIKKDVE